MQCPQHCIWKYRDLTYLVSDIVCCCITNMGHSDKVAYGKEKHHTSPRPSDNNLFIVLAMPMCNTSKMQWWRSCVRLVYAHLIYTHCVFFFSIWKGLIFNGRVAHGLSRVSLLTAPWFPSLAFVCVYKWRIEEWRRKKWRLNGIHNSIFALIELLMFGSA